MEKEWSRTMVRYICACFLVLLVTSFGFAFDENNPDSPTPILLSGSDSTRVLAVNERSFRGSLPKAKANAFIPSPKTRVVLFVGNLDLMPDEGANAFRVYLEDNSGKLFRLSVEEMYPVETQKNVYAVVVKLYDETGFGEQPQPIGDYAVFLTWRGMSSNRLKLGIGKTGGEVKDVKSIYSAGKAAAIAPNFVGLKNSGDRIRFLEQATFGMNNALDQRIRRIGIRTWLAEQFQIQNPTFPYPTVPNFLETNTTMGCPTTADVNCNRDNYSMYQLQKWFGQEALYGDDQLKRRVAWALSQIWVVSGVDTQQAAWEREYLKALDNNSFGNYRTLMSDMTFNPAMGDYLNMLGSTKTNPNENYPREILQLFTVGLFMLNQDGTIQRDGNNLAIPSYTQTDVNNFTKVFTGWNLATAFLGPNGNLVLNYRDPMVLNQANHDVTAKTLLNYPGAVNPTLPANQNGLIDANQALDNLFNHPNVGPFVGKHLIQALVTSDPTPAYVSRVSAAFNNNGFGVRGDMKAVIRAILTDPEARGNIKTDPTYGKLREPVQLATNIMRNFNVVAIDGVSQSDGYFNAQTSALGQNQFNSPTVFNYYSPDYVVPGTSVLGPEFGIQTTGTAVSRINFINTIVYGTIGVGTNTPLGTKLDLTEMQNIAAADTTSNQLLDALNNRMMHGTMDAAMRSSIMTAVNAVASTSPLTRARVAIYLIATSSQYQVQR